MINIQHSDVEILIHPKNERRSRVRRTIQSVRCLSSFVVWLPPALGDGARSFAAMQMLARRGDVAIVNHNCSRPWNAFQKIFLFFFFLGFFCIYSKKVFLLLGLLRRGGERSMKVCPQILFLCPILDIILKVWTLRNRLWWKDEFSLHVLCQKINQLRCSCTAATCKSLGRFFFGCVLRFMEL